MLACYLGTLCGRDALDVQGGDSELEMHAALVLRNARVVASREASLYGCLRWERLRLFKPLGYLAK